MSERLPIADGPEVRAHAAALFRRHRRALAVVLGLHGLAAVAGLAGPRLLGELVQAVKDGTTHVPHRPRRRAAGRLRASRRRS